MEVHGTIYMCYVWVAIRLQQSDSAIVEWICWCWVNTVSTNTWPGSKHKHQTTAGMKVWMLDAFYWNTLQCLNSHTVILIATKLLWQGLKGGKNPKIVFCPKGITTNQLKWLCIWQFSNCGLCSRGSLFIKKLVFFFFWGGGGGGWGWKGY